MNDPIATPSGILVTGSSGFVGRHVLYALRQRYPDVLIIAASRSAQVIDKDLAVPMSISDITNEFAWQAALQGVSHVVHLAGLAHQPHRTAAEFMAVNAEGTAALARACAGTDVRRLVMISSVAVMGDCRAIPPMADEQPANPVTAYGLSKHHAERRLAELLHSTMCDWVVLRPPLVYGPSPPGNLRRLMTLIKTGLPLPLALADNPRSMISIENLTSAIVAALCHPDVARETFLIADAETLTLAEVITAMAAGLGRSARLFPLPVRVLLTLSRLLGQEAAMVQMLAPLRIDPGRFSQRTGWQPHSNTASALQRVWNQ